MRAKPAGGNRLTAISFLLIVTAVLIPLNGLWAAEPPVTDATIRDAVEDELFLDTSIRAHLIDVTVSRGIVTLDGGVDNLLAKRRSERIAEGVKGVRAVVNTIEVLPPILRSDSEIKADVKQALLTDPATDSYGIDVRVKDNVVTLSGSVNSWQERELSGKVAMGVNGVKAVQNELSFEYTEARPDKDIEQDVKQALRWDVRVDHALIDVDVVAGKVTLSGTVGSLSEKRQAIEDAYVANVTGVDAEKLEVRLWARDPQLRGDKYKNLSDEAIRKAVSDALLADPRVSSFNVRPEVFNGVATLRGKVDNLKARRAAGRTAANTVGVSRVVNRIKVRPLAVYPDAKLKTRIEQALAKDPIVESYEISVTVRNGVVDLFGSVGTVFEKLQAEDLATRVNGVIGVNNHLVVSVYSAPYSFDPFTAPGPNTHDFSVTYGSPATSIKTDARIKQDIQDEFFWSPFVNGEDIKIRVEEGKATLTGTVDSLREVSAATENAYEGGAVAVNNRLTVK